MKGKVQKSSKGSIKKKKKKTDFISGLPSPILHHILSYLSSDDSVKTSVLSKPWNSVWKSFPILEFTRPKLSRTSSPRFEERLREYLYSVDRSLQNFIQNGSRIERLNLDVRGVHKSSVPLVSTWLPLALHNGVSELRFDVSVNGKDSYPLPETTFAIYSLLLRDSSKFFLLKKLELCSVSLSKKIVQDIVRNCPNLTDLFLWYTHDLETLNISKHYKLVNLTIEVPLSLRSVVVDAFSLKCFTIVFDDQDWPCKIDLASCYNLRELSLNESSITDSQFNQQISRFSLLEVLKIECCHDLRRIRFALPRLKHLDLRGCHFEAIEIDAPILSEFVFTRTEESGVWPLLVSAHAIPGSLRLYYVMVDEDEAGSSFWFLKIRKFLSVPFKSTTFELDLCTTPDEISFKPDELRECVIPPPVEIDYLKLRLGVLGGHSYNWEAFFDGLLWSCHPKEIYISACLTPTSRDEDNCLKVLHRMLNESECQLCCNLSHCKCWRSRFKAATIESTGGVEFDEINIGSFDADLFSKPKYRRGRTRAKENFKVDRVWWEVTFRFEWEN